MYKFRWSTDSEPHFSPLFVAQPIALECVRFAKLTPMLRRLLNIASLVCLVACVALMGMWLDSLRTWSFINGQITANRAVDFQSLSGHLTFDVSNQERDLFDDEPSDDWQLRRLPNPNPKFPLATIPQTFLTPLGFQGIITTTEYCVVIPYWFLVLVSGSLAMLFRPQLRWRYTLRSLFIATTFLAVVLGMIAWLDRAWIGK